MKTEQAGIEICADGIDVVHHQVLQLRVLLQQAQQHAVAQHVRNFVPVAGGMKALEWEVVGIIGTFGALHCPLNKGGVEAIAHFFFLHVEFLLGHFLPGETEIAGHGNEAQADAAAGRKDHLSLIAPVLFARDGFLDGRVGEIAGGDDVRDESTGFAAGFATLG